MCGIVGYIGQKEAADILLRGLSQLEYRGYDSAGIATLKSAPEQMATFIRRSSGKLSRLKELVSAQACPGDVGIGHTRWATHGKPTDENAHPHHAGTITVVHNGIIENQYELKQLLKRHNRKCISDTDTEVVAHLIDIGRNEEKLSFLGAVQWAVRKLKGAFALAILDESSPGTVIGVKQACPLVVGLGDHENFLASDYTPALSYTNRFLILEDGDIAEVHRGAVELHAFDGSKIERQETVIDWSPLLAQKDGHKHFMHKEIFEQPKALENTLLGRYENDSKSIILDGVNEDKLVSAERISIVACGSSYYAGLIAKYLFEAVARVPVEVDLASEFRYRNSVLSANTLVLGISQSGETADTLAALQYAREQGAIIMSVCNVVGAAIPRLCAGSVGTFYTRAGPEVSVASTKAFTAQLMALHLLALHLAQKKNISGSFQLTSLSHLKNLCSQVDDVLQSEEAVAQLAKACLNAKHMLYLGRGPAYPAALEGALKMKEISYVHAEGFAAGELKHGAIALVDPNTYVVALALKGPHLEKTLSNIQEVKTRGGKIITITDTPGQRVDDVSDYVLVLPESTEFMSPILASIQLQLLAYHLADLKGLDVDQPRNLAKSVTVE